MSVYYKYPYLLNDNFLKQIDRQHVIHQYVKITLLNWKEQEMEEIQGYITGGNLSIDGSSATRRTGSISFSPVDQDVSYDSLNAKFSLNKRIKLEIGVANQQDSDLYSKEEYPIIWFPQGVFFITGCSINHSLDGVNVNLNIMDKMGLLNGKVGGILPSTVEFDKVDKYNNLTHDIETANVTLYQIIMEAVHHWGQEQVGKILIGDLSKIIKKVVTWDKNYTLPSDVSYSTSDSTVNNSLFWIDETQLNSTGPENPQQGHELDYLKVDIVIGQKTDGKPSLEWKQAHRGDSAKSYSDMNVVGYKLSDFYYPGELTGQAGEAVTNILDKVRDCLGNYEYFYDIDGNFRFQEIKNYLNTSLSSNILAELNMNALGYGVTTDTIFYYDSHKVDNNAYYIVDRTRGKVAYDFSDNALVCSISNSPNYDNIKNDFIIWGKQKTTDGSELPIRYHLAIDEKPPYGHKYYGIEKKDLYDRVYFSDCREKQEGEEIPTGYKEYIATDWRSELYFQGVLAERNATDPGYYYAELANEWPKQYDLEHHKFRPETIVELEKMDTEEATETTKREAKLDSLQYFLDFIDTSADVGRFSISQIGRRTKVLTDDSINCLFEPETPNLVYIKPVINYSTTINNIASTSQVDIKEEITVGQTKELLEHAVIQEACNISGTIDEQLEEISNLPAADPNEQNDNNSISNLVDVIRAFDTYTPVVGDENAAKKRKIAEVLEKATYLLNADKLRYNNDINTCKEYTWHYALPTEQEYSMLSMSNVPNGADVAMKDLLYQYVNFNEQITLTTVPIYHLEPNTLIKVRDVETGINNLFLIKSINIPLGTGQPMTINATKALSKI